MRCNLAAFLILSSVAFAAPPRIAVAIAEAEAFSQYDQRRELPNDFSNGASGQQSTDGASEGNAQQPKLDLGRSLVIEERDRLKAEVEDLEREMNIAKDNLKAQADRVRVLSNPREDVAAAPSGDASRGLMLTVDGPAVAARQYFVTVYTADWCGVCKQVQKRDGNGNDRVVLNWVKAIPPLPKIVPFPTYVWQIDGQTYYASGAMTLGQLVATIEDNAPAKPEAFSAISGFAGTIHGKARIQQVLNWWREHIGDRKAEFRWSRNGAQAIPILRAKSSDWSVANIYGTDGEFSLKCDGASLPVTEARIGYRVRNGDVELTTFTHLPASLFELNPPASAIGAEPVGMDPLTILTVLQVLRGVWSLLHPSCDLVLPGSITATGQLVGDELVVDTVGPSLRIVALFTFTPRLDQVRISEQRVRLNFSGSIVKSREFVVGE